jgi:phthalate 4,5-cis-dihydrodiol dehydrogenase
MNIGVVGLGRGFMLMAPTFRADPRCRLVAAPDPAARGAHAVRRRVRRPHLRDHEALCADPAVDVVYIASPHQHHADQAVHAAMAGKHMLVEKPMALDPAQCGAMISAARTGGVHLIVGPSHGFDAPVAQAAEMI